MSVIPDVPITYAGLDLVVLDSSRRLYAGLSHDGSRWHVVAPLEAGHPLVGDGLRQVGQLGCTCLAGVFRGRCWRVAEAEAWEARPGAQIDEARWDSPAGAGEEVEAFRG